MRCGHVIAGPGVCHMDNQVGGAVGVVMWKRGVVMWKRGGRRCGHVVAREVDQMGVSRWVCPSVCVTRWVWPGRCGQMGLV